MDGFVGDHDDHDNGEGGGESHPVLNPSSTVR